MKKDRRERIGNDVSEYQKWVDYDMKKYGRISDITKGKIRKAGLSIVKDQYGDYEVIADRPIKEAFPREEIVLNFDRALLDKWIDRLNQHDARYDKKYHYTEGGKYIKVIYTYGGHDLGSVFAFVDADGNIYKPAGWNAPAKGVRARIDDNPPVDGIDLYAPRYRKAVYGESLKEARERHIKDLSDRELIKLRKEIVLGSLYYRNYDNSFGIDEHEVCDFFDGFLDWADEEYKDRHGKYAKDVSDLYDEFDNDEDLIEYAYGIEW